MACTRLALFTACLLAAGTFSLISSRPAAAQVVVDNGPISPIAAFDISGFATADDFSIGGTTSFNAIRFWTVDGFGSPTLYDGFSGTLSYFVRANNAGIPGAILNSGSVSGSAITLTDTGQDVGILRMFQMDVVIPQVTLGGGTYWLQLKEGTPAAPTDNSLIFWIIRNLQTGFAAKQDTNEVNPTTWSHVNIPNIPLDAAFELRNNVSAAAPESGTLALLALSGLPLIGAVIRRSPALSRRRTIRSSKARRPCT